MVVYDKERDEIYNLVDSFKDREVNVNFFIIESGNQMDGIMDYEYFDNNCEVLGWL